jgi:Raf kinase inhibitor-like YbhB/YbcL family protein
MKITLKGQKNNDFFERRSGSCYNAENCNCKDGGRMRRFFFFMGVLLFTAIFSVSVGSSQESGKGIKLKVTSPAFENNKTIPSKYGCDGSNVNPSVKIENVPPKAKSLALVFDDQDAPRGTYVHWVLWNIDPSVREIRENSVPEGAIQGTNDFKKNAYGGPCPPTRPHKYALIVYALDVRLNLEPKSGKADLEKAMEGHIIAQGQLMGVYKREKKR